MTTIAHLIAPISFGGGESLLVNLLNQRKPGLQEIVISIYRSDTFNRMLEASGVKHFELQELDLGHGISKMAMAMRTPMTLLKLPYLLSILRQEGVDLLHAHGYPGSLIGGVACRVSGVPGIYTHHFHRIKPSWVERTVLGWCYRGFEACTGVSEFVTDSMCRAFPTAAARFRTIHNCVGSAFVNSKSDPEFMALRGERRALFVQIARFSPFKNQLLVVEALGRLAARDRSRIRVVFAGEGPERAAAMARAKILGLTEETHFLGFVPYERIPGLLACADFGLFPSDNEGFGIGAVECLAAGLPVLTLDNELMREIVGDAGIRCPRDGLGEGFVALLNSNSDLRKRTLDWSRRFLPEPIKEKYLALYRSILPEGQIRSEVDCAWEKNDDP